MTSLATLKLQFSDFEIKQLLDKYRTPEGLVDYKTFCQNVDKVFSEEEQAKEALEKNRSKAVNLYFLIYNGANCHRT